jgi:hypothetical protein
MSIKPPAHLRPTTKKWFSHIVADFELESPPSTSAHVAWTETKTWRKLLSIAEKHDLAIILLTGFLGLFLMIRL